MTQQQKAIRQYIGEGQKKKAQIVNKFDSWYYTNSSFHIGNILTRMVKKGDLRRIKKGVYENANLSNKPNTANTVTKQISLF